MGRFTGTTVRYLDLPRGGTLAAFVAERYRERLLGLAWLTSLPAGAALLIPDCRSIHTLGMRFRLDVVFVEIGPHFLEIVELHRDVPRRRVVRAARGGVGALELPAGAAQRFLLAPGLSLGHRAAGSHGLQPKRPEEPAADLCDPDHAW